MKFKLDENIGRRGLELLEAAGHDVTTVRDQGLGGATDEELFEACSTEGRALITLDHDFGQVMRFPPEKSAGIIPLHVGPQTSLQGRFGSVAMDEDHVMAAGAVALNPARARLVGRAWDWPHSSLSARLAGGDDARSSTERRASPISSTWEADPPSPRCGGAR